MAIGQQRLPVGAGFTTFRLNYMSSKSTNNDEPHLKHQRPVAGESRRFTTGEAVFFSPLPVPTGQIPMDLREVFLISTTPTWTSVAVTSIRHSKPE